MPGRRGRAEDWPQPVAAHTSPPAASSATPLAMSRARMRWRCVQANQASPAGVTMKAIQKSSRMPRMYCEESILIISSKIR